MRVLITGGGGQAAQALMAAAPVGVAATALPRHVLDITRAEDVMLAMTAFRPDAVINTAAFTGVDAAEDRPEAARLVNATAVAGLAAICRGAGVRLVQLSTDYVFDGTQGRPYRPDDIPAPTSVYGATKLDGEMAARDAGPDHLVIRTAWLHAAAGRNFPLTILERMRRGQSLRVVNDQIGTPTSARSLADGVWRLLTRGAGGIFHFTDSGVASWYDLAVAVQEEAGALGLTGAPVPIRPVSTAEYRAAARRPAFSVLDMSETIALLGHVPPHWRDGVRQTLKDLKDAAG